MTGYRRNFIAAGSFFFERDVQQGDGFARAQPILRATGFNQKTVAKWKQRETVADLPTGPKEAKSTVLSIEGRGDYRCCPAALQGMLSQRVHPVA